MLANLLKSSRSFWCFHNPPASSSSSSSLLFGFPIQSYNHFMIDSKSKTYGGVINRAVSSSPVVFQKNPPILIKTLPFSTSSKLSSIKNVDKNNFDKQLSELDYQLNEVKVFQDEQIIQLSFKSGQSINFTMSWLRNLCSCQKCLGNKLHQVSTIAKEAGGKGNNIQYPSKESHVSRIKCHPGAYEFEIEWLDDDYRSHVAIYDLRHLILKKP